jgi:hypothetical protein
MSGEAFSRRAIGRYTVRYVTCSSPVAGGRMSACHEFNAPFVFDQAAETVAAV